MKKMFCMLLAALLLLAGCQAPASENPDDTTAPPTETQAPTTVPAETAPELVVTLPGGEGLAFANPGKVRIDYTGNRSYVKYITSPEELPEEEALAGFDAAFFERSALLIVVETVGSGSVKLEIESIQVSGGTASVSVKRSMSGDVGTTDMATWLLWAEVDKGLDYEWTLKNASQLPMGEKY